MGKQWKQCQGLQRVGHDWATELNLTEVGHSFSSKEQASSNFMASVTICSDFGAQENKVSHRFNCLPIYLPWSNGTRCYDLSFWMLSFKPTFSLSSFTIIKRLFSSLLSAISVMESASKVIDFSPDNLDSNLCFIQSNISHDVLCI